MLVQPLTHTWTGRVGLRLVGVSEFEDNEVDPEAMSSDDAERTRPRRRRCGQSFVQAAQGENLRMSTKEIDVRINRMKKLRNCKWKEKS